MKTTKRMAAILLAAAVTAGAGFGVLPIQTTDIVLTASAATYGDLEYVNNGSSIEITGCNALAASVEIPATIDGLPVTKIAGSAFYFCKFLTSVTIPSGVTTIGDKAFFCCTKLTNVSIPDTVTTIEHDAFYGCESLQTIYLPNSINTIGMRCFSDCTSLTTIAIPDGVMVLESYTFQNCTALKSITIPASVLKIDGSFYQCSSLTDVYYGGSELEWTGRGLSIYTATSTVITMHYNSGGTYVPPTTEPPTTEEPTTEPTEPPTTEEPTTEPPTTEEPTTEPTEPPTTEEPATEAPTEPPTEPPTDQTETLFGDINGDDRIDASDASAILVYVTEIGAGSTTLPLDEYMRTQYGSAVYANPYGMPFGDINSDYKVDASDAAAILVYATELGAGTTTLPLDQFMWTYY